ncbi:MAG: hypothetical protein V5A62_12165 [Haloarculaceae archaeon]
MPTADTTCPTRVAADGGDAESTNENVLVLGSTGDRDDDYCSERLSSPGDAVSPSALLVSLDESPDERFDAVVRSGVDQPRNVAIVCCDGTRGAAAASAPSGAGHGPGLTPGPWIATVESPGDLTGLGVRIRQALSSWADDPGPTELCFHDLETLVEHVDARAAFRFCHAVIRHIRSTDARSHFHLAPDAVDERTLHTLRPLFDRVEDRR